MSKHIDYITHLQALLDTIKKEESTHIEAAAEWLVEAIKTHHNIFVFGASHAGIISQELFYRAGGLALINPVFASELDLSVIPVTQTSKMERLDGYGTVLAEKTPFQPGDVLIAHSVSGRNTVMIDFVTAAKDKGVTVIAITNQTYSNAVTSRHPSKKRLFELADVTIDNHGDIGDAVVKFASLDQRVAPSSTVTGAAIANSIVVRTVERCLEDGLEPPIFYSANLDGGDEKNKRTFDTYKKHIFYM